VDGSDIVRFTSRSTSRDLILNAMAQWRRSGLFVGFGTFAITAGVLGLALGDLFGAISVIVGLLVLTGLPVGAMVWMSIRRRGDLMLAPLDIEADGSGIAYSMSQARARQEWSIFRRARETSRAFVLDSGVAPTIISKQGLDPSQVDGFRTLLVRAGLFESPPRFERLRLVLWAVIGLAAGIAIYFGSIVAVATANATLDVVASVEGRRVTVVGTTNLPDGAVVGVDVTHVDEADRSTSEPFPFGSGESDWIRSAEARVQDGTFTVTLDVDGWPAGRGEVWTWFWVDRRQPPDIAARFGVDGSGMRGPNVYNDGGTWSLQVFRQIEFR